MWGEATDLVDVPYQKMCIERTTAGKGGTGRRLSEGNFGWEGES